jgi:hypothetical protein
MKGSDPPLNLCYLDFSVFERIKGTFSIVNIAE